MERNTPIIYVLMFLVFFQAASGLYGGGALIWDPSGTILEMPLELLHPSPFSDYLLLGVILLIVLGIYPVIVFYSLYKRHLWAETGALILSLALIVWIGVEIIMIGYHTSPPLQLIYGLLGFVMLILSIISMATTSVNSNKQDYD
ncbi:hypothetical protein [Fodinibius saliphilus]|uniref:hypothetical protein n=1 Tax=Fodinibius saliphilus TaxID=1920650 RepID=UPI001BB1850D|nr:hypothetical protein [Fodinibius saliphilus]